LGEGGYWSNLFILKRKYPSPPQPSPIKGEGVSGSEAPLPKTRPAYDQITPIMKERLGGTGVSPVLAQSLSLTATFFMSDETILGKTLPGTTELK
jgi:hypothetical protein